MQRPSSPTSILSGGERRAAAIPEAAHHTQVISRGTLSLSRGTELHLLHLVRKGCGTVQFPPLPRKETSHFCGPQREGCLKQTGHVQGEKRGGGRNKQGQVKEGHPSERKQKQAERHKEGIQWIPADLPLAQFSLATPYCIKLSFTWDQWAARLPVHGIARTHTHRATLLLQKWPQNRKNQQV